MLTVCAALLSFGLALPQEGGPGEDVVEETVQALQQAFSKGDAADRIEALGRASSVPHKDVVQLVKRGLKDRETTVVSATIESLRYLDHKDALTALHKAEKTNKKITKDDDLHARLLKAIGQHGDEDSIDVLAKDLFGHPSYGVVRARILGLVNIRDRKSVETLIGLMNKGSRKNVNPYMSEFRLAMAVLTGRDEGKSVDLWMRWWNDHKKGLEVRTVPPKLPRELQQRWDNYWGIRRQEERGRKRGERGK